MNPSFDNIIKVYFRWPSESIFGSKQIQCTIEQEAGNVFLNYSTYL